MTSKEILLALSYRHDLRTQILVPNVSWGLVSWGECDLLAVSEAGYVTEYEIKLTLADFKREWKKKRWISKSGTPDDNYYYRAFRKMVKFYYIVVPEKVSDKVEPLIPEHIGAGLISIVEKPDWRTLFVGYATEVQPAIANRKAKKLTDEQRMSLGRLAAMRYWNLARSNYGK